MSTAPATEIDRAKIAQDEPDHVVTRPDEQSAGSAAERAASAVKNTGGRPTSRTPEVAKILCDAIGLGVPFRHACAVAGICYQTFCDWRKSDEKFKELIEGALAGGVRRRLQIIERAMESKDEAIQLRASCWWLEHVFPSDFSRTRVEVTGADAHH